MLFRNLKAEMARQGISNKSLAEHLNITDRALRNKLSGASEFTWEQVCKIQTELFPHMNKDYLFEVDVEVQARQRQAKAG